MIRTLALAGALLPTALIAQPYSVYVGYRTGYAFMDQLNSIINAYNANEPGIVNPMPDFHFLHGPAVGAGAHFGGIAINLGYSMANGRVSSTMMDSFGVSGPNDLILKSSAVRLEFGKFPEPGAAFAFGFGLAADYTPVKLTMNSPSQPNRPLDQFHLLSVTPNAQFYIGLTENLYLRFNPYFQFNAIKAELLRVYTLMVPSANIDPAQEYLGKFDNFGIVTGLMLSFD